MSNRSGFTLVEVLISMSILILVMITATAGFANLVQLQQKNAVIRQVQQTTRYVSEVMARDIRNSDHYTLDSSPYTRLVLPTRQNIDDETKIRYTYVENQGIYRVRCAETCPSSPTAGSNLTSGVRVIDLTIHKQGSDYADGLEPLRISLDIGQENEDLTEDDPYFYEYNTATMAVPRR